MSVSLEALEKAVGLIFSTAREYKFYVSEEISVDIVALSEIPHFNSDEKFLNVIIDIVNGLKLISTNNLGEDLTGNYIGYISYHIRTIYEPNPNSEDVRIIYRDMSNLKFLFAIGHRYMPDDFYERIARRL